jgi:ATP-dependent Clp protease ATP-binding subunit ClpC
MAQIPIKDILITARQESHRMRHFYLGVEHLFIALLEIKSGITSAILSDNGLAPEYVIDRIRRKVAKGSRHRLWAGVPNTPRTDVVLSIAHEIAQEDGRKKHC